MADKCIYYYLEGMTVKSEVAQCVKEYNIGFLHTLMKLNEHDEFDYPFKYSLKTFDIIGTNKHVSLGLRKGMLPSLRDLLN